MFKNAKVGTKILLGFSILLILMLMTTITAFYNFRSMNSSTQKVANDAIPIGRMVEEIGTELANEEAGVRGYIASNGDIRFLESYEAGRTNIDQLLTELAGYFPGHPALASVVENEAKPNIAVIQKSFDEQIQLVQAGKIEIARDRLGDGKAFMDAYGHVHKKMRDEVNALSNDARSNSETAASTAKWSMGSIFLVSLILGLILAWRLSRSIADRLANCAACLHRIAEGDLSLEPLTIKAKDEIGELGLSINTMLDNLKNIVTIVSQAAKQVAESSEELSASAEQSAQAANQVAVTITEEAQGVEKQSKATGEASAVVEQMNAGVQEASEHIGSIAGVAEQTSHAAKDGGKAISEAVNQMQSISQSSQMIGNAVTKLNERSQAIGEIVDAISNIAGQTNLLALNAAIEAARAGEQGKGFAVVAEEVRQLAEQSQNATKKIAELIGQIQQDTEAAVTAMNHGVQEVRTGTEVVNTAGQSFSEIEQRIHEVSLQIGTISANLQQLAAGSRQIVSSVQLIDTIAKETAAQTETVSAATEEQSASMEEIAASSQHLSRLAQDLQSAVNRFRLSGDQASAASES